MCFIALPVLSVCVGQKPIAEDNRCSDRQTPLGDRRPLNQSLSHLPTCHNFLSADYLPSPDHAPTPDSLTVALGCAGITVRLAPVTRDHFPSTASSASNHFPDPNQLQPFHHNPKLLQPKTIQNETRDPSNGPTSLPPIER